MRHRGFDMSRSRFGFSICVMLIMALTLSSCATTGGGANDTQRNSRADSNDRNSDSGRDGNRAGGTSARDSKSKWSLLADILIGVAGGVAHWYLQPYSSMFLEPVRTALYEPPPQPQPPPRQEPVWAHNPPPKNTPGNYPKTPRSEAGMHGGNYSPPAPYQGPYRPGRVISEEEAIAFWKSDNPPSNHRKHKKEEKKSESGARNSFWNP